MLTLAMWLWSAGLRDDLRLEHCDDYIIDCDTNSAAEIEQTYTTESWFVCVSATSWPRADHARSAIAEWADRYKQLPAALVAGYQTSADYAGTISAMAPFGVSQTVGVLIAAR